MKKGQIAIAAVAGMVTLFGGAKAALACDTETRALARHAIISICGESGGWMSLQCTESGANVTDFGCFE
jgi:hypothetical protein